MVYPHEQRSISDEPYFRRIWQHYRDHTFKVRFAYLVQEGLISEQDAAAFSNLLDFQGGSASINHYIYQTIGKVDKDETYDSTHKVMEALGLNKIEINQKSAQSYEEQFWDQFDVVQELTEEGLARELPVFITDPSNRAKVEALIAGRKAQVFEQEATHKLASA